MGGGLMQLVAYGLKTFTFLVIPKSLSSKLSTADTPTSLWNLSDKLSMVLLVTTEK